MVTKSKPPASKSAKTTAIVPWAAEMAGFAKKQAASEKPMGIFKQLAVKSGMLVIDDKPVPGNALRAVILAATHENQYYDKPYDSNTPMVPACFAFGDVTLDDPEGEMSAHPDAMDPQGQEDPSDPGISKGPCANCWANKMGSADIGKGKACKNIRRMILTTEDALESPETMKDAEARMFKIPVMSVMNWVNFVHECEETYKRPYWGVVVTVSTVPDPKSQFRVKFTFEELIQFDQDLYEATKKRTVAAARDLLAPYPKIEEEAPPPPRGKPGTKPTGPATRKSSKY